MRIIESVLIAVVMTVFLILLIPVGIKDYIQYLLKKNPNRFKLNPFNFNLFSIGMNSKDMRKEYELLQNEVKEIVDEKIEVDSVIADLEIYSDMLKPVLKSYEDRMNELNFNHYTRTGRFLN